jgi:hypothetical protein
MTSKPAPGLNIRIAARRLFSKDIFVAPPDRERALPGGMPIALSTV